MRRLRAGEEHLTEQSGLTLAPPPQECDKLSRPDTPAVPATGEAADAHGDGCDHWPAHVRALRIAAALRSFEREMSARTAPKVVSWFVRALSHSVAGATSCNVAAAASHARSCLCALCLVSACCLL